MFSKLGFRLILILSIVFINWLRPSNAKNSAWSGTIKDLATTKAIIVKRFNEGGQSIKIYEKSLFWLLINSLILSFNKKALLLSLAVSTSKPDKSIFDETIFKLSIFVFLMDSLKSLLNNL